MPRKLAATGIRGLIDERGLRYGWVAEKLGVSPSQLTRIMNGERRVNREVVARLADVLAVPPERVEAAVGEINAGVVESCA